MIRVHIHFTVEAIPHLNIGPNTELGHLYSDDGDIEALHMAAESIGVRQGWFQDDSTLPHYDLWRRMLRRAKVRFEVVDDQQFSEDVRKLHASSN